MPGLEITITQADETSNVDAEIWCPAFVRRADHHDVEAALAWVRERLDGAKPFEEYSD